MVLKELNEFDLEEQKQIWLQRQLDLQSRLITIDDLDFNLSDRIKDLKYIAGVDISFIIGNEEDACAALVILEYPSLKPVYEKYKMVKLDCPYISTFLAFREVKHLIELYNDLLRTRVDLKPQVIFVDGNGYLHPRKMGLASHFGVLIDVPTIGIGKNFLTIDGLEIDEVKDKTKIDCPKKGQWLKLIGESGTCWGASLATNDDSRKPIYISIGHRICLETAVELVKLCSKYKIPEPVRVADLGSREYLRNLK